MGVSTDAILVFGIEVNQEAGELPEFLRKLAEEEELDADEEGSFELFERLIARDAGILDELVPGDDGYYKRIRDAEQACPVKLVSHCSGGYAMHILALNDTETRARRGFVEEIDPAEMAAVDGNLARIEKMQQWCEAHGVPWQEPKWLLCSMWW